MCLSDKTTIAEMSFVLVAFVLLFKGIYSLECGDCDVQECPNNCEFLMPDPCGCCLEGICARGDGEACSSQQPCSQEFDCQMTEDGGVCVCKQDKRSVCGLNGITYSSICDLNLKTNAGLKKWGVCDTPPMIITGPKDQKLAKGQPLTLDCEVKGYPVPSIEWHFSGKNGQSKILPSDDQLIAIQVRGGPEPLMVTSWAQIVAFRDSDEGLFTCVGTNVHGEVQGKAFVTVQA